MPLKLAGVLKVAIKRYDEKEILIEYYLR